MRPKMMALAVVVMVAMLAGAYMVVSDSGMVGGTYQYAKNGNTRIVVTGYPANDSANGQDFHLRLYLQNASTMNPSKAVAIPSVAGSPSLTYSITCNKIPGGPYSMGTIAGDYYVTHPDKFLDLDSGILNGNAGTLTLVIHTNADPGISAVTLTLVLHVNGG
jgi:hypothetical protein